MTGIAALKHRLRIPPAVLALVVDKPNAVDDALLAVDGAAGLSEGQAFGDEMGYGLAHAMGMARDSALASSG